MADTLGITEEALIAAATTTAGFPLETSALSQLLDLIEAFTKIADTHARSNCVDFIRSKVSV